MNFIIGLVYTILMGSIIKGFETSKSKNPIFLMGYASTLVILMFVNSVAIGNYILEMLK